MKCQVEYTTENASTIEWISDEYNIKDLLPFLFSIICDGGEDFEELYGDDFQELTLENFKAVKGDDINNYLMCYKTIFEFDEKTFQKFKNALDHSSNQIEIKIGFKTKNGAVLDNENLWEGISDIPTELTIL